MARVYVSSTFADLKPYRERVRHALRRRGHEDVAMELYGAEDKRPLDKCLADVAACNLYIGIFAWRYGYIPPGESRSITELEYQAAIDHDRSRLLFLLADDANWPINLMEMDKYQAQKALRERASQDRVVMYFTSEDRLYAEVTDALVRWESEHGTPPPPAPDEPEDPAAIQTHLRAYLAALAADCRSLPLQLLDAGEGERKGRIGLPQVYVPLDVVRPPERLETEADDLEARYRTLARGEGEDRAPAEATLVRFPEAVLIGDAGSGKSALINHLAWRLLEPAAPDPPPAELARLTPVRIILRRVAVPEDAEVPRAEWLWQALEADVADRLQLTLPEAEARAAAPAVARELRRRWAADGAGCLLLLDGLDEVPETGRRREHLIAAVALLIASRGKRSRALVTARPYAYAQPRWQLPGVPALVLAPFAPE